MYRSDKNCNHSRRSDASQAADGVYEHTTADVNSADRKPMLAQSDERGAATATQPEDGWDAPCRIMPPEHAADQLLIKIREDANFIQSERRRAKEETAKTRLFRSAYSGRIESLTASLVHDLLGLIEQFVVNEEVQNEALIAYLDRRKISQHGHDKTIYARVARIVGKQVGRSLRNKISDNLAGARLLGISSIKLNEAIENGVQTTPEGEIRHGVSALGTVYRNSLRPNPGGIAGDEQGAGKQRDDDQKIEQLAPVPGSNVAMHYPSETLMQILSSPGIVLRVSVGRGREVKVRRVRSYGNRVVLSIGRSNIIAGRPAMNAVDVSKIKSKIE